MHQTFEICYEKAAHKGLDYGSVRRLFMVSGRVPWGHEVLRAKGGPCRS